MGGPGLSAFSRPPPLGLMPPVSPAPLYNREAPWRHSARDGAEASQPPARPTPSPDVAALGDSRRGLRTQYWSAPRVPVRSPFGAAPGLTWALPGALTHGAFPSFLGVQAGSELLTAAERGGLPTASEVFADRAYTADGNLAPRALPGAVIHDAQQAAE